MEQSLNYNIKRLEEISVLVVSFEGEFGRQDQYVIERCQDLIIGAPESIIILNFKNVPRMFQQVMRSFVQLQIKIREISSKLKTCNLNEDLRSKLLNEGIIKEDELLENPKKFLAQLKKEQSQSI